MFQANVRNRKGRVVGTRPVTATGRPLAQNRALRRAASRSRAPFEVVDFSEQDGSLTCIAQLRATLAPAP